MARYTIDGQILTDLGDYVRGAKFVDNPKNVYTAHVVYQGFEGATSAINKKHITYFNKNKVTILSVDWIYDENSYSTPRVSIGSNDNSQSTFFVVKDDTELPYSCTVSANGIIYIGSLYCAADVTYMVEPCDDNGEVIKNVFTPEEMVNELNALPVPVVAANLKLTGNATYRFAYNAWNWIIENYGNMITTSGVGAMSYMFYNSDVLEEIPFDINVISYSAGWNDMFNGCYVLKNVPKIIFEAGTIYSALNTTNMFRNARNLKEIPDDYFSSLANEAFWEYQQKQTYANRNNMFDGCYSLRKLPDISVLVTKSTSSYSLLTTGLANSCYSLDEITNLPVLSTGSFSNVATNCYRLKDFAFAVQEDGTPFEVNWSNVNISLSNQIGYGYSSSYFYNSGITNAKQVTDDASYQALKNDPDWWTTDMAYSRYNRASAVATINSLPDTSERGGANTITFKGAAGSKTDAGAISDLSEEEIAVAAAKGWTVTFA